MTTWLLRVVASESQLTEFYSRRDRAVDTIQQNWDLVAFLVLSVFHAIALVAQHREIGKTALNPHADPLANTNAGTALTSASTAGITAVSILIPASFVIVQIAKQPGGVNVAPAA